MIRPYTAGDAPAIADIYAHYVSETVISFETVPPTRGEMELRLREIAASFPCLVDEERGVVRGYAYAHLWKERAAYAHTWEATVYLHPAHRGQGVGSQLLGRLVEECRKRGCHALVACVTGGNEASEAMLRAFGFARVSLFPEVGQKLGRWLDVVDYELLL